MKPGQIQFPLRIPFVEELGLELWGFGGGKAELRVDLAQAHLNSWEVAHGGVLMTMLDVAMAHAARSANSQSRSQSQSQSQSQSHSLSPDHGPGVVTVEMKTTFMRPAEGELRALGTLLHKTTTMAFTEGSVFNGDGQLCAHATATFKFMRALPTGGRQTKPLRQHPSDKDAS